MSTGDVHGNVGRLRSVLRELKYTHASSLPEDRLVDGDAVALLPVLHYCLLGYSTRVAQEVNRLGYELQAKTDERFVEHAWKLMRDHMGIFPQLSPSQFLTQKGFAERKLILVAEVAKTCKRLHSDLSRKAKLKTKRVAKDAHLESYFPPVRGRASGSGNNNSAAVAESSAEAKVVAHHSSPPPLPSTPPQLVLAGAGAPVEMSEERSAASSEYTYDDDDDDDDSGSSGSEGGYESSGGEEEGEISDEEGDRSRAAVLFKHSPVGADAAQPHTPPPGGLDQVARATPGQRAAVFHAGASRPFSEVLLKEQVGEVMGRLESFQENVMAKFLLLEGRVRHLEAALARRGPSEAEGRGRPELLHQVAGVEAATSTPVRVALATKHAAAEAGQLSPETSSFIAQVEGRRQQTQLLLDSLA